MDYAIGFTFPFLVFQLSGANATIRFTTVVCHFGSNRTIDVRSVRKNGLCRELGNEIFQTGFRHCANVKTPCRTGPCKSGEQIRPTMMAEVDVFARRITDRCVSLYPHSDRRSRFTVCAILRYLPLPGVPCWMAFCFICSWLRLTSNASSLFPLSHRLLHPIVRFLTKYFLFCLCPLLPLCRQIDLGE